ncbi:MAG: sensor histidine kinase [Clostridiales bacterium]|nr:sensor histidine kinase [Clostridiales bacterium]
MRRYLSILRFHLPWLLYALAGDVFFAVLLWITDASAFRTLTLTIVLFSILTFLFVCVLVLASERRMTRALDEFLKSPDETHAQLLLSHLKGAEQRRMKEMCDLILQQKERLGKEISRNEDYEEYVEAWAHEAKTPIALLTMILDNNRDTLDPEMVYKIEYIRSRISECVDQMLQYSRIKGEKKDYRFEHLPIRDIIEEVVEDYRPLLVEKDFLVIDEVRTETIYSDRRALRFILGQIVSNSIKYSAEDPQLRFFIEGENKLVIEDNGIGIKSADLPFIFERGFTGDTGEARKKATGMGLYLVRKMADDMKFTLDVSSETGKGFRIVVQYPMVEF